MNNIFIGTYTNACKSYCDKQFFENLAIIGKDSEIVVVDNTHDNGVYLGTIHDRFKGFTEYAHLNIDTQPERTLFLRAVCDSANYIRDRFLESNVKYLLIVESDVIPPTNLLNLLEESINKLPENLGILGAIYYRGHHDYNLIGLQPSGMILSGCTLYSREFIKDTPFTWSPELLGAFPDAHASVLSIQKGFVNYNNHDIICDHLANTIGSRNSIPQ